MIGINDSGYFYNQQLKTYVLQFMAIFSSLQVEVGKRDQTERKLIPVPITYGAADRVVASILADNTQNKPLRLPTMSAYVRNVDVDLSRMHGMGVERRISYTPVGGLVPNDTKVIHQRMPVPYRMTVELAIYVSNTEQHFQVLEQILPFFEPTLTLQTSDGVFDMKRLTTVELKSVSFDSPYPVSTDKRIIQSSLSFDIPIHLDIPAQVRNDFIQKVMLRIGAVDASSVTSSEMLADLDAQGLEYRVVAQAPTI